MEERWWKRGLDCFFRASKLSRFCREFARHGRSFLPLKRLGREIDNLRTRRGGERERECLSLEINRANERRFFLPFFLRPPRGWRWRGEERIRTKEEARNEGGRGRMIFENRRGARLHSVATSAREYQGLGMVHLRQEGLNHPLSRWHFRGWGADFIVFRTSLYTRVRHFSLFVFSLCPSMIIAG